MIGGRRRPVVGVQKVQRRHGRRPLTSRRRHAAAAAARGRGGTCGIFALHRHRLQMDFEVGGDDDTAPLILGDERDGSGPTAFQLLSAASAASAAAAGKSSSSTRVPSAAAAAVEDQLALTRVDVRFRLEPLRQPSAGSDRRAGDEVLEEHAFGGKAGEGNDPFQRLQRRNGKGYDFFKSSPWVVGCFFFVFFTFCKQRSIF